MSRGGRGGFGRGANHDLPFEVDPELQEELAKYGAEEKSNNGTDDRKAFLFPPYPGGVPRAPPVTEAQRRRVNIMRELRAKQHASPFYTGPPGTVEKMRRGEKRSAADFDAFNDQPTYGKRFEAKEFKMSDPKKLKFANPAILPRELWDTFGITEADVNGGNAHSERKIFLGNSIKDKLAKFDDDADEDDEAQEDEAGEGGDDEEAEDEQQQETDFEDAEDENDDYNAEQYFSDGDGDGEDAGDGDGYGDDGDEIYCYKNPEKDNSKQPQGPEEQRMGTEGELNRRALINYGKGFQEHTRGFL
ncbi:Hypothetical protein R9X50_00572000 [Acrodontium crateriforme]|uniref:DNA-directed RNA polymerase III subunit n=1 Tax=Acrodontium crateriforme TaxID=150365 RepID=A0AAQ3MCU8_9PEZI|nr:Hypothetical protein R9X50_00572000 [Acrodontium crateriforme]